MKILNIKSCTYLLLIAIVNTQCLAQVNRSGIMSGRDREIISGNTSEFTFRNDYDEILMPVFVLGAVAKPGLYHVPMSTDLTTLMALTGGPAKEAELDSVMIKSSNPEEKPKEIDFESFLENRKEKAVKLSSNDVVFFPTKRPVISQDTATLIATTAGILGIALSSFVLTKELRK